MRALLFVGLGGGLGAMARYGVGALVLHLVGAPRFPLATFFVNVLGCLLIGVIAAVAERWHLFPFEIRLFIITGVLGGFTTFSSFGYETIFLLRRGDLLYAGLNVLLSLACGLGAVWLGGRLVLGR
jgi:CrcB protein